MKPKQTALEQLRAAFPRAKVRQPLGDTLFISIPSDAERTVIRVTAGTGYDNTYIAQIMRSYGVVWSTKQRYRSALTAANAARRELRRRCERVLRGLE